MLIKIIFCEVLLGKTLGEQLDAVQKAIDVLESGKAQSYEIEGRRMTYVDLRILYEREEYLIKQIEKYGSSYIRGAQASPIKTRSRIVFES